MDAPRLEHVRVNVSDFGRAVVWYEDVLGLPAEGHWPPDAPKYAHFQTGAAQFAISEVDPVPAAGRYNFSVKDVDAWWGDPAGSRRGGRVALRYAVRHAQVHGTRSGRE